MCSTYCEHRNIYKFDLRNTGNCIKVGCHSMAKLIEIKTDKTETGTDILLDKVKSGEKDQAANILFCFSCDKLFNCAVSMEKLKRWKHCLEPDCTLCGKVFNSRMYLAQHKKTMHCGQHLNICQFCGKGFMNKCPAELAGQQLVTGISKT